MKYCKKVLACLLCAVMLVSVLPVTNVFAEEENVVSGVYGKIVWSVNKEDETLLLSYDGVVDFASNETLPYTAYSNYIKNVIITEGATGTHRALFNGLKDNLENVSLPATLNMIASKTFFECDKLKNVNIPDSVTRIGDNAFYYCRSLTSVTIPDSVTSINENAFYSCNSLTSVTIPDSVKSIGVRAFTFCSNITSIMIPDSVTNINAYAFVGCSSLTSVVIGSRVERIDSDAFNNTQISKFAVKNDTLDISNLGLWSTAVIYANEGSKAQEYALSTGREFRYLEDFVPEENPGVPCEHIYNDKTTEPTCLAGGYIKHICEKCGDTYIDNVILPLGHSYGDPIIDTPATCTENGTQRLVCTACGNEVEETITAPGHVIIVDRAVPATCEEEGLTEGKHCINCGKVFVEQQTIEALSHHYVNHEGREATCTEGGWKPYQTCTRCDYTNYATLTALGHTDSNSDGICDRCSEKTETSAPAESDCTCRCHSKSLLYLIAKFLYKYIGINIFRNLGFEKLCDCGINHW